MIKNNTISDLENTISDLKNKNLLINKYEQEIQELKKDNEIKRYGQEIQELKKQLNDYKKAEEEKIYDNIPYLETEEEAAENITDIYKRKGNKARTFPSKHNVKKK